MLRDIPKVRIYQQIGGGIFILQDALAGQEGGGEVDFDGVGEVVAGQVRDAPLDDIVELLVAVDAGGGLLEREVDGRAHLQLVLLDAVLGPELGQQVVLQVLEQGRSPHLQLDRVVVRVQEADGRRVLGRADVGRRARRGDVGEDLDQHRCGDVAARGAELGVQVQEPRPVQRRRQFVVPRLEEACHGYLPPVVAHAAAPARRPLYTSLDNLAAILPLARLCRDACCPVT